VFHRGVTEDFGVMGCDTPSVGEWSTSFQTIVLLSFSTVK